MKRFLALALLLSACSHESATCARPAGAYHFELDSPTCGEKVVEVADLGAVANGDCATTTNTFEGCTLDRASTCTGYSDHLSLHVDSKSQLSGSYETDADGGTCDYTVSAVHR